MSSQGGTLIFLYIRSLGLFFCVQNFEFQYFWGFSKKKNWGYEDFMDIFLGCHHKIGLYLGVISMHFRVFHKGKVQNGGGSTVAQW